MATRTRSRRALRDEHDQAARLEPSTTAPDADALPEAKVKPTRPRSPAKSAVVKAPPKPRIRKKVEKAPPVLFARWAVCDNGMKRVAVFEYRDRAGADAKLAQLMDRKAGTYFLLLVKDPGEPPAPATVPAV